MDTTKFASDLGDPRWCVFRHVSRTSRAVTAIFDQAFARVGLTAHQFNLMMTMQRVGPSSIKELATIVGMDPSTVPRALKPLTEKGWVQTKPGQDKRKRITSLSAAGTKKLTQAEPVWATVQQAVLEAYGDDPWRSCMSDLKALREASRAAAST